MCFFCADILARNAKCQILRWMVTEYIQEIPTDEPSVYTKYQILLWVELSLEIQIPNTQAQISFNTKKKLPWVELSLDWVTEFPRNAKYQILRWMEISDWIYPGNACRWTKCVMNMGHDSALIGEGYWSCCGVCGFSLFDKDLLSKLRNYKWFCEL